MQAQQPQQSLDNNTAGKQLNRHVAQVGQHIPLAVLTMTAQGQMKQVHLHKKLICLKEFDQREVTRQYHFENPFQSLALEAHGNDIGKFNGSVINFHHWLVKKGYCEETGSDSGITVKLWTVEEINTETANTLDNVDPVVTEVI